MPGIGFALGIRRPRRREADPPSLVWGPLDARLDFSRPSPASFVDSSGFLAIAASGTPRFDRNPASLAPLGLLIEEQRTNLLPRSAEFDNPAWTKAGGAAVAANAAAAPDGTLSADKLSLAAGGAGGSIARQIIAWPGGALGALSAYVRQPAAGGAAAARVTTDNAVVWNGLSRKTLLSAGQWRREKVEGTLTASGTLIAAIFGTPDATPVADPDCAGDVLIWGAQLEAGAFATTYIPTGASAAARAADVCSTTDAGLVHWLAQPGKTVVVRADSPASGARRVFHAAKTGSEASDYISIWTSDATVRATVVAGGVTQADLALGTIAPGVPFTVALSLAANRVQASLDGAAKASGPNATVPTCDKLWFGCGPGGEQLCGHLSGAWRFLASAGNVEALSA